MAEAFLIVGWGGIAQRHARNLRRLRPDARITVLRRQPGPMDPTFAVERVTTSWEEALMDRPAAAVVASPASLHGEAVERLAGVGVPLLLEKPMAATLADGAAIVSAAAGLATVLGYNLRFHRPVRLLCDAIHRGVIGKPLYLRAEVGQYLPDWRSGRDYRASASARSELGGGALLELSHEIDLALWLLGEVAAVHAWTGRLGALEIDVEDTAEIILNFTSGALGSVHLDFLQRAPRRGCLIVGELGSISWDAASQRVVFEGPGGVQDELQPAGDEDRNAMYLEEMRHFLACVAGSEKPAIDPADGLRVLRIVEAARTSSAGGKVVIL